MLDHLRILLVDDDPSETEMYAIALGQLGAEVATAATVDEALSQLALRSYDAVVSDIRLPDRDGFELARELRAAGVKVPAIALTGLGGGTYRDESLRAGFDEYVTKPCLPSQLAELIVEMVARVRAVGDLVDDLREKHARQSELLDKQRELVDQSRRIVEEAHSAWQRARARREGLGSGPKTDDEPKP